MQAYQQAPQVAYAAPQQFAQPGYAPAAQQGYMQAPLQQPMGYPYGQQMQQQPQIQPAAVDAQPILVPAREGLPRQLPERRGAGRIGRGQTDRSGAVERA